MPSPSRAGQRLSQATAILALLSCLAVVLSVSGTAFAEGAATDPSGMTVKVAQPPRAVPASAQAHQMRGRELALAGDVDGAIAEYREALRIDPEFVLAYANLGHALRSKGQIDEAIKQYRAAVALEAGYVPAHYALGRALVQKGELQSAIAHLHIARQLAPEDPEIRIALSSALLKWGDTKGAITQAREAVQLSADNPAAHYALGQAMAEAGMFAEAVTEYETAAKNDATNDKIQVGLGIARTGKGDMDGAIEAYKKAVELAPNSAASHNNLGAALLNGDKVDEAVTEFQNAVALDSISVTYQRNLAGALRKKGDNDGAIAAYHEALRIDAKDSTLHEGIGLALLQRSDLDAAVEECRSSLDSEPSNADVEKALATITGHFVWAEHLKYLNTMRPEAYVLPPRIAVNPQPLSELQAQMNAMTPALMMRACQDGGRSALIQTAHDLQALAPTVLDYNKSAARALELSAGSVRIVRPVKLPDYVREPLIKAGKIQPDAADDLTPEMRKSVCAIAIALQHWDDLTEAIGELTVASRLRPDCAVVHNNLGRALLEAAQTKAALAEFNRAIALAPDLTEAHFNAGVALGILDNMPVAVKEWRTAIDLSGDKAPAALYNYLGIANIQATEFPQARARFEAALRADPDFAPAKYNLGIVSALELTSLPLAKTALDKSRYAAPLGMKSYNLRGEFIVDDKLTPTLDALVAASSADEAGKGLYHYVGVEFCLQPANAAEGVSGIAVVHNTEVGTGLNPDCTSVHNNLGVVMAARNDLEGAQKMLTAAVAESPRYALAHWNLGQVLMRQDKKDEAQKELDIATKLARGQNLPYLLPMNSTQPVLVAASDGTAAATTPTQPAEKKRYVRKHIVPKSKMPHEEKPWTPGSILKAFNKTCCR